MRLDLSDPVCTKSPANIYSRVGIFTSPSGKSSKATSSSIKNSSSSSVAGGKPSYRSTNSDCDSGKKSELFYLQNYTNQHLDGELKVQGKEKLCSDGIESYSSKEDALNGSDSEESSEENEFEMGEEGEIKVEDD